MRKCAVISNVSSEVSLRQWETKGFPLEMLDLEFRMSAVNTKIKDISFCISIYI